MRGKRTNGAQIDLGLALLSVVAIPGESLTQVDIAAWCGCTRQRIEQIEAKALRKIRNRIHYVSGGDPVWHELMNEMFNRRVEAVKTPRVGP